LVCLPGDATQGVKYDERGQAGAEQRCSRQLDRAERTEDSGRTSAVRSGSFSQITIDLVD